MLRLLAAAAALSLGIPVFCGAQTQGDVARPEVKVGDRWTYQRFDYDANQPRGRYEMRVVFAERGVIQVVMQRGQEEIDTAYTSEWNAMSIPGRLLNPHTGWFKFPLQVGATHDAAFDVVLLKKQVAESKNQRRVKVVGWEDVVVPAGKFRALKIVSEGNFQRVDNTSMSGTSRNVIWYVPEVRRWAKITFENRPKWTKGQGEYSGEELVEYKLQ